MQMDAFENTGVRTHAEAVTPAPPGQLPQRQLPQLHHAKRAARHPHRKSARRPDEEAAQGDAGAFPARVTKAPNLHKTPVHNAHHGNPSSGTKKKQKQSDRKTATRFRADQQLRHTNIQRQQDFWHQTHNEASAKSCHEFTIHAPRANGEKQST